MRCFRKFVKGGMFAVVLSVFCLTALTAAETSNPDAMPVVFFFTPGCRMCKPTKEAVRNAEARFGKAIDVEWVDLSDPQTGARSARRYFDLLNRYGVEDTPELAVFLPKRCLAGPEAIQADLLSAVELTLAENVHAEPLSGVAVDRMGFYRISLAALADGVNPCAFATVVLLVSMLTTAGRSRRQALCIGLAFALAVFATYFLIGLFLYGVLQKLQSYLLVSDLVYYGAFLLCVIGFVLSLHDAVLRLRGKPAEDMLLALPGSLRERIRKQLSAGVRSGSLFLGAFVAGISVSFLEAACTGQVYVPVLAGMAKSGSGQFEGLMLLAWYNLLFILPLLLVLGVSLCGIESARIASFARKHNTAAKIFLALIFLLMALWLGQGLTWPPGAR